MDTTSRSRRGTGTILLIVALFVIVVAQVALARQGQGSQTLNRVKSASVDAVELDLAGSALDEAALALGQRANDPSQPIFQSLRRGARAGTTLPLAPANLQRLIAADPDLKQFEVGPVTAKLAAAAPLSIDPTEAHGTWELTATVRQKSTGVTRRVTAHRGFKEALLSAPRPYDQFSVLVLDGAPLVGNANRLIDESVDALGRIGGPDRAAVVARIDQLVQGVNARLAQLPAPMPPLDAAEYEQPIRAASLPAAPAVSDDVARRYHHFPAEYCVAAVNSKDLASLWLEPKLTGASARIQDASAEVRQAQARLEAAAARVDALASRNDLQAGQADAIRRMAEQLAQDMKDAARQMGAAMEALAARHNDLLAAVWAFQGDWIETGGAASRYLRTFEYKLASEEWSKRAFVRFAGADAVPRFLEFLHRYENDAPVNAVVYVDNPGTPLVLSGRAIHGKLAVYASGDVQLADVALKDRANDLLVVESDGKLAVNGNVEAALIPHGSFESRPDARIEGLVIFQQVPAPERLQGHVAAVDGRYFVGEPGSERLDRSYVSLAPWSAVQTVERK